MKILKPGNGQKGWSIKVKCTGHGNGGGGCGATLRVEQADLMRTHSSAMGESSYHATFECVSCKVLTDLDEGIPANVWAAMPDVPSGRRRVRRSSEKD